MGCLITVFVLLLLVMTGTLVPILWGFGWALLAVLGVAIVGIIVVRLFGPPLSAMSRVLSSGFSSAENNLETWFGKRLTPWVEALLFVLVFAVAGILLSQVARR